MYSYEISNKTFTANTLHNQDMKDKKEFQAFHIVIARSKDRE